MIREAFAIIALAICGAQAIAEQWDVEAPIECGQTTRLRAESTAWEAAQSDDGSFVPRMAGGLHSLTADQPDLPFFVRMILIPRNCAAAIEIQHVDCTETNVPPVSPVAREEMRENDAGHRWVERVPGQRSPIYERDAFWPEQILTISYASQGTQRWARIVFYPLQYNPRQGILRWNQRVEARLTWKEP